MTEYVHLVGADDIRSAANTMSTAANEMKSAASNMAYALEANQRFMTDWLQQFRDIMEAHR